MKTFSVAVAVAVVLAFICIQESSAFPATKVQELEEPMSNDNPVAADHEETSVDSLKMPYNNREKRDILPDILIDILRDLCRPCCLPTICA